MCFLKTDYRKRAVQASQRIKYCIASTNFKAKAMLSKTELEFLKSPESFEADYRRALRHRLKFKVQKIRLDVAFLEAYGVSVTENCNGVTEFCNGQQNQKGWNQAAFGEMLVRSPGFEPGIISLEG